MATTTYSDDVIIDGSEDEVQLRVQGHSTQTEALQEWQDSGGTVLAQVTEDGRFLTGDTGLSTPDALIEAHRDDSSSLPQRGFNSLGRIASALASPVTWLMSELLLVGTAAISSLHTAVRGRLTHSSTGDSSNAELRAGDFETINQSGDSVTPVGVAVGVQGTVDNQANAYLTKASAVVAQIENGNGADIETAYAFEVAPPVNAGTLDAFVGLRMPDLDKAASNYAINTGKGWVKFGDELQVGEGAGGTQNGNVNLSPQWDAYPAINFRSGGTMKSRIYATLPGNGLTADTDFHVSGALSKGSGTFLIDHPLDPENKDLYHGFVEAPRFDLIYRGQVTLKKGKAVVSIDAASKMSEGTFDALTQNPQVFLQCNQAFEMLIGEVREGQLHIQAQNADSTALVDWQVIAERADSFIQSSPITDAEGQLVPEQEKEENSIPLPEGDEVATEELQKYLRGKKGHVRHPRKA